MEMPDPIFKLWCLLIGKNNPFLITPSPTLRIARVKELIKEECTNRLQGLTLAISLSRCIISSDSF